MASIVIEETLKLSHVSTVYFYCNYQDEQRKSFLGLARALISQLLSQNDTLLPFLHDKRIASGQVALKSSQLSIEILGTCLKSMPKTYIIIDGLDECDMSERNSILSFFAGIIEGDDIPGRLRALFVSQDENDIRTSLRAATLLRLTDVHNRNDIDQYATEWVAKIEKRFGLPHATVDYIKTAVCEGSEGMCQFLSWLLVQCYIFFKKYEIFSISDSPQ